MIVFLNGQFLPEQQALISVFDRGFLYGDGLFEGIRIYQGKPFRWEQHLERFRRGAAFLKIAPTFSSEALRRSAQELIARNEMPNSFLRLVLSRGVGVRGYSSKGAERPTLVMSLHPAPASAPPPRWRLVTAPLRLPANEPLSQFKTCNKLAQVLARAYADAVGADEALLLNSENYIVEASSGNLFWVADGAVCTAPLAAGVLPGVTRAVVVELCHSMGLTVRETSPGLPDLMGAKGLFLSLSSIGLAEGVSLDGQQLARSAVVAELDRAYWNLVREETA
jgi:aminodeoxychorismate lyase